eukprot:scaffold86297_cov72-Attheya_sp.AAC.1
MDDSQKSDDRSGSVATSGVPSGEMSLYSHSDSGSESDNDNSDNYLSRSYNMAMSMSWSNISTTSCGRGTRFPACVYQYHAMFLSILTLQLSESCIISHDLNDREWVTWRLSCR